RQDGGRTPGRERLRSIEKTARRNIGSRETRHQPVGIGAEGKDDVVGENPAAGAAYLPAAALAVETRRRRTVVEPRAKIGRRPGEPAGIGERLKGEAAVVDETADVARTTRLPSD